MGQQWLTTNDLAHQLNIDRRAISQLAKAPDIGAVKVGGKWRFPPDVIQRLQARSADRPADSN